MVNNDYYTTFLNAMTRGLKDENFDTKAAISTLISQERRFVEILSKTKSGMKIFEKFVSFIKNDVKSILVAKIYFREREKEYSSKVSPALKKNEYSELIKFSLNYKFARWASDLPDLPNKKRLLSLYEKMTAVRQSILIQNLPLVVNRARLYQFKTRKGHIDAMEFIQSATEGFLSATDKMVPDEKTVEFNGVAIGWMQSRLMADFSETFVKLTIYEKKILYRAKIALFRHNIKSISDVLDFVKVKYPQVTKERLKELIMTLESPGEIQADIEYNTSEVQSFESYYDIGQLNKVLMNVSNLERKVLLLKGGFT